MKSLYNTILPTVILSGNGNLGPDSQKWSHRNDSVKTSQCADSDGDKAVNVLEPELR